MQGNRKNKTARVFISGVAWWVVSAHRPEKVAMISGVENGLLRDGNPISISISISISILFISSEWQWQWQWPWHDPGQG